MGRCSGRNGDWGDDHPLPAERHYRPRADIVRPGSLVCAGCWVTTVRAIPNSSASAFRVSQTVSSEILPAITQPLLVCFDGLLRFRGLLIRLSNIW